jgi:hypothetical protein
MGAFRLLLFFLLIAVESHAQDTIKVIRDSSSVNQVVKETKFYYGGYLNLAFGSYTSLGVEPLIAYKITPKLSAGTILTYEYISDNTNSGYNYKSSNYGGSIFCRYRVLPQFYFHTEFSEMKYDNYNTNGNNTHYWVPFLFLGGGFSQQLSQNTWLNTQILFDVIQNEHSPYSGGEPFYSIGFGVGF